MTTARIVWRRRLKPGAEIRFVTRIAEDGAFCVNYDPSCIEFYPVTIEP